MIRWLRSKNLILAIGAALASGFNFYSFVFLPTLVGTGNLEEFVRENYLGGLYLFGIGSSIAPFGAYVFLSGQGKALFRYAIISVSCFSLLCLGGISLLNTSMSLVCLGAALCMHLAGFLLASLIRQEKILAASVLQVLQPMLFAGLVTLYEFGYSSELNWPYSYSLSCFFLIFFIAFFVDWNWLIDSLSKSTPVQISYSSIITRILMSASFPLFFQLELILVGNFSSINLGDYAVVQKLYASVAISLFGSVGLRLVMNRGSSLKDGELLVSSKIICMALIVLCAVLLVGFSLVFMGKSHKPTAGLVVGSAIVSAIYTVASFISLLANTFQPYLAVRSLFFSLSLYLVAFYLVVPQNSIDLLILAGFAFLVYIISYQFIFLKNER